MSAMEEHWQQSCEHKVLPYRGCDHCGAITFVPRLACAQCSSDMVWRESAGRGTVYAVTRVHKSTVTAAGMAAPYTIGYVQLDEGFLMLTTFTRPCTIGERVAIEFISVDGRATPVAAPQA
ncbi:MAG: OB-fold domain-containing protein [Burkholderiaceae bacterium]|nr:OB-fold domain-containing protein [Burkholderiaceae bacterium]